jgi:hypothetical protein
VFVSCKALAGCTVCLYGASPRKFAFFKSNFHCHLAVCALSHSFGLHTCRLALSSLWGEFAFTPHVLKNGPHAIAHAILDAIPRTRPHATTPRALATSTGMLASCMCAARADLDLRPAACVRPASAAGVICLGPPAARH